MIRVGLIGLGDIAAKAYLPVLSATPGIELHLATRDSARLKALGDAYRIGNLHSDIDSLLATGLDAAFVSAATQAHPDLVERLLRASVATYVDKPLADNLAQAERLVALAEQTGTSLMVGFNRRYAPAIAALRDWPRDLIVLQKHRHDLAASPRRVVFDDFIHVVDTLRFLAPGAVRRVSVEPRVVDGALEQVALTLSGDGFTAIGLMSRMSGSDEESIEVTGAGRKTRVDSLRETVMHLGGGRTSSPASDWKAATWVRGFDAICAHFLGALGGPRLDAGDALETHRLCETIVAEAERH